ncbi:MAG TPA: cytochrome b/b6 domain-containing protein [Solirubrobacteraceae bacterium]|jgi:formate dehydrogenase subunit gamma
MAEAITTSRSGARAPSRQRYVQRFTLTERLLHWVHASAFFVLLGSGLILYLPALSTTFADRALIKDVHFYTAVSWAGAMVLIALLGNRRAVRATVREVDLFDRDDRRFLTGHTDSPQGRFNAGQKVNVIVTAAFATLFFVSGMLLWLGERNTDFRLGGTIYLHDALMYLSVVIVVGHLYLALINRSTRHSLRGMVLGTVRDDWARAHHAKWRPEVPATRLAAPLTEHVPGRVAGDVEAVDRAVNAQPGDGA